MKRIIYLLLSGIILITSCQADPLANLVQAQKKVNNNSNLSYTQTAFYPSPIGEIDTLIALVKIKKAKEKPFDYDFLIQSTKRIDIRINDKFRTIQHQDKLVKFFRETESQKEKFFIKNNNGIKYSPLTLLNQHTWIFLKDTLIDNVIQAEYYQIDMDTIINGNTIYTTRHLFIDTKSKLLDRLERRNYYKGKLSQTVVYEYTDYDVHNKNTDLKYDLPVNYRSVPFGKRNKQKFLSAGQKAPLFTGKDLQNKGFNLADYKGQKVLLNFSIINCGACQQALNHFNQNNYQFSDKIKGIYINPIDKEQRIRKYADKINIPFPILFDTTAVDKLYGVSAFPTFILIDENGIIEQIVLGYDKVFIENLKM